jgi:hypothetical protein
VNLKETVYSYGLKFYVPDIVTVADFVDWCLVDSYMYVWLSNVFEH